MSFNSFTFKAGGYCLRPLKITDHAFFNALHQDAISCIYTGGILSSSQVLQRFQFCIDHNKYGSMLSFIIHAQNNSIPLGMVALTWSKTRAQVELGIMLLSDNFGQGIASKALPEIVSFASTRLKLDALLMRTHSDNIAMIKAIKSLACATISIQECSVDSSLENRQLTHQNKSLLSCWNIHYINH